MAIKAKRDKTFNIIIICSIIPLILMGLIFVILLKNHLPNSNIVLLFSVFVLPIPLIIWCAYDIKYVFNKDHLFLKAGIFKSRIPYNKITSVKPVTFTIGDFLVGFRMQSAKDGLIIRYAKGYGEVKISPKEKSLFMAELKKRIY